MRLPPSTSAPRLGDRLAHYRAVPRTRPAVACSMVMGATLLTAGCTGGTPWGATPQNLPQVNLPRLENIPAHIDAGTNAGAQRLAERVRTSAGLATALNPYLGYENATRIAQEALLTGRGVAELVEEMGLMSREELAAVLAPEVLTAPRRIA